MGDVSTKNSQNRAAWVALWNRVEEHMDLPYSASAIKHAKHAKGNQMNRQNIQAVRKEVAKFDDKPKAPPWTLTYASSVADALEDNYGEGDRRDLAGKNATERAELEAAHELNLLKAKQARELGQYAATPRGRAPLKSGIRPIYMNRKGDLVDESGGPIHGDESLKGSFVTVPQHAGLSTKPQLIREAFGLMVEEKVSELEALRDTLGDDGAIVDESVVCTTGKLSSLKKLQPEGGVCVALRVGGTAGATVTIYKDCALSGVTTWDDTDATTALTVANITGDVVLKRNIPESGELIVPMMVRKGTFGILVPDTNAEVGYDMYPTVESAQKRENTRFGTPMPDSPFVEHERSKHSWSMGGKLGGKRPAFLRRLM